MARRRQNHLEPLDRRREQPSILERHFNPMVQSDRPGFQGVAASRAANQAPGHELGQRAAADEDRVVFRRHDDELVRMIHGRGDDPVEWRQGADRYVGAFFASEVEGVASSLPCS